MPELPEVETMCRGIAQIVGRTIESVSKPACRYRPIAMKPGVSVIARRLQGEEVTQISRLGKRVLLHTCEWALVLQPKMTGLVAIELPPDPEHVRLQIDFTGSPALRLQFWDRRGLGTVELLKQQDIAARIIDGRLGPDALAISLPEFSQRLAATQRAVKVALLGQKLVAGVGNLYASEMLHVARIHPQLPAARLSRSKVATLHAAMQAILLDAIAHEGSTLKDGTYRNTLNDPGSYQNCHLVYDRAGLPCSTCQKGVIERMVQAQRSTFFCPRCQPTK
ncbi:MAG: bifunctional DNA-formamidopyrimidine glycosylase/DNA-(apurinic or apyrimidinic site) lyase [Pirellulaceae bacterium]|nr:bifunctional DNA-formamidopyrimidine glycosylase/DNA-(apurinic or apyrimidinic site) lyase [Pirellulaceae bacterium]